MNIPQFVLDAMTALNMAGYECYLVGGCVRDALMGQLPHDYDLTTSALPEQMLAVFSHSKIIETGIKHGTVTLLTNGGPVEITTYRVDGEYKDNRRPESVSFTPNLSEDLSRRDFTVNAIAMDAKGETVDIFGGREDINNRIIRCVGDPSKRFNEDGLRILRALRFAAVLNFSIDYETAAAVHKLAYLLNGISAERVREELFKLICGVNAKSVIGQYADVLLPFLPGISATDITSYLAVLDDLPETAEIRMASLYALYNDEKGLRTALRGLKVSNRQLKCALTCLQIIQSPPTDATKTAFLIGELGERELAHYLTSAQICGKDIVPTLQTIALLKKRGACYSLNELAVTGSDLIEIGISGKKIGEALQKLFSAVAEGKVKNEKQELLNFAKEKAC